MALGPPPDARAPDPLALAVQKAREEPFESTPQRWVEISDSIMSRVRTVVRPSEPLVVHSLAGHLEQDARGSRTYVSARVVVDGLRRLLASRPTHAPSGIDLEVADARLLGVDLALVASYGVALRPLGDEVRTEVLGLLGDLLGPDPDLDGSCVRIRFVDVVDGDPNLA